MANIYWWEPKIIKMPEMELRPSNTGGYVHMNWGTLSLAPDTFPSDPPMKLSATLTWGLTSIRALHLFTGKVFLRYYDAREVKYDLQDPEFDTFLLSEGTDEQGETVYRPLVIGTVNHMLPQRTGTDVEQRYYWPDFNAFIGSGTNAYDDGIIINDNWIDNEDGTCSRSIDIVGKLSFSGMGNMTTLADVFSWGCSQLGLTFINLHGAAIPIDHVEYTQQRLIDFLDKLARYCNYMFYIKNNKLYLLSCVQNNSSQTIGQYDHFDSSYSWPLAIKSIKAVWKIRKAAYTSEMGYHLEEEEKEAIAFSSTNSVGEELEESYVFNEDVAKVKDRLSALLIRLEKPTIELSIPLDRLPNPGERVYFTDVKQNVTITGDFWVRELVLDYAEKSIRIYGEGEVDFT